jgi:hypothetical protein
VSHAGVCQDVVGVPLRSFLLCHPQSYFRVDNLSTAPLPASPRVAGLLAMDLEALLFHGTLGSLAFAACQLGPSTVMGAVFTCRRHSWPAGYVLTVCVGSCCAVPRVFSRASTAAPTGPVAGCWSSQCLRGVSTIPC